jgi:hypothetical protein
MIISALKKHLSFLFKLFFINEGGAFYFSASALKQYFPGICSVAIAMVIHILKNMPLPGWKV